MKRLLQKIYLIFFLIFSLLILKAEDKITQKNEYSHIIVLKDGNEYKGRLKSIKDDSIIFEMDNIDKVFKKGDIERIQFHKKRLYEDIDNISKIEDPEIKEIWETSKKWEPTQALQVVILLDEMFYDFKIGNKVEITIKKAFKVLNEEGKNYSTQYFYYLKDCSKGDLLYGITILPDGSIRSIDESTINDEPINNEIPHYDNLHRIKFGLKDVDIGSVFIWEAKIEREWDYIKHPILIEKQLISYDNTEKSILKIKMPTSLKINYNFYDGFIPYKRPDVLKVKNKDGILYTIEQKNTEGFINDEKNSPSDYLIYPTFYAGPEISWQKLSSLYFTGFFNSPIQDKIKKLADDITKIEPSFIEKLSLLYNHVNREIDLTYIDFDQFQYIPLDENKLTEASSLNVLDKSYLFTRLANSVGIPVKFYFYRNNFKNQINNICPSIKQFDSAICEILIDKKPIYFSFEDQNYSIDQADYSISSAWALNVSEKNSKINRLKDIPYDYNKYQYDYQCFLKDDNTLYINKTTTINGNDETIWRRKRYLSKEELDKFMESKISTIGNDVTLSEYKFVNKLDEFEKPIVINENIMIKNYSYNSGKNIKLFKIPEIRISAQSVNKLQRNFPYKLDNTMLVEYNIEITIPDKYKVKYIPAALNLNYKDFSLLSNYSISNNKIKIAIKYYFMKDLISTNQYLNLKDWFEKFAKLTDEWILLEVAE